MKKALLYLLLVCAAQLITGAAVAFIWRLCKIEPEYSSSTTALSVTSAVCSVALLALFLGKKWCPISRNYIKSQPWETLFWTVILACGAIIPMSFLTESLPESWQINLIGDQMANALKSKEGYFLFCMVAPLEEEVIFRGAMIRSLMAWKNKPWLAIVVSAVLFAAIHANPAQIPYAFLMGLLFGWLFVNTGSIVPGVILHWINNSSAYLLLNLFPLIPADAKLAAYFGGNQSAVYQAVAFSLMIALPALYQLYGIFKRAEQRY